MAFDFTNEVNIISDGSRSINLPLAETANGCGGTEDLLDDLCNYPQNFESPYEVPCTSTQSFPMPASIGTKGTEYGEEVLGEQEMRLTLDEQGRQINSLRQSLEVLQDCLVQQQQQQPQQASTLQVDILQRFCQESMKQHDQVKEVLQEVWQAYQKTGDRSAQPGSYLAGRVGIVLQTHAVGQAPSSIKKP